MMGSKQPLSVYIHIPFCVQKCLYCDFVSRPSGEQEREDYVEELVQDIARESMQYKEYRIKTVFFGGGTPSLLSWKQMKRILDTLRAFYHMEACEEITVEVNPATADEDKLRHYYELGINRLSIGLQSTNDAELKLLGRIHTYEEFLETYHTARIVGYENINIDLMAAIPSQTLSTYLETLKQICKLRPEHISAYSLIIEEGTPFYELYGGEGETVKPHPATGQIQPLVSEEEERLMYEKTKEILVENGYYRYEISNYARLSNDNRQRQYECTHNNVYWERGEYIGFGTNASSMIRNTRFVRGQEPTQLSIREQMEETMYLGLRRMEGISKSRFYKCFCKEVDDIYGEVLENLQKEGFIKEQGDFIALTERGIDISNYVLAQFLL